MKRRILVILLGLVGLSSLSQTFHFEQATLASRADEALGRISSGSKNARRVGDNYEWTVRTEVNGSTKTITCSYNRSTEILKGRAGSEVLFEEEVVRSDVGNKTEREDKCKALAPTWTQETLAETDNGEKTFVCQYYKADKKLKYTQKSDKDNKGEVKDVTLSATLKKDDRIEECKKLIEGESKTVFKSANCTKSTDKKLLSCEFDIGGKHYKTTTNLLTKDMTCDKCAKSALSNVPVNSTDSVEKLDKFTQELVAIMETGKTAETTTVDKEEVLSASEQDKLAKDIKDCKVDKEGNEFTDKLDRTKCKVSMMEELFKSDKKADQSKGFRILEDMISAYKRGNEEERGELSDIIEGIDGDSSEATDAATLFRFEAKKADAARLFTDARRSISQGDRYAAQDALSEAAELESEIATAANDVKSRGYSNRAFRTRGESSTELERAMNRAAGARDITLSFRNTYTRLSRAAISSRNRDDFGRDDFGRDDDYFGDYSLRSRVLGDSYFDSWYYRPGYESFRGSDLYQNRLPTLYPFANNSLLGNSLGTGGTGLLGNRFNTDLFGNGGLQNGSLLGINNRPTLLSGIGNGINNFDNNVFGNSTSGSIFGNNQSGSIFGGTRGGGASR